MSELPVLSAWGRRAMVKKGAESARGAKEEMEAQIRQSISNATREARTRLRLTQEQVAERVGLVPAVYGRIERGRMTPSVNTLCRLCVSLGVTPSELLGVTAEAPPSWWQRPEAPGSEKDLRKRQLWAVLERLDTPSFEVVRKVALVMRAWDAERSGKAPGSHPDLG